VIVAVACAVLRKARGNPRPGWRAVWEFSFLVSCRSSGKEPCVSTCGAAKRWPASGVGRRSV